MYQIFFNTKTALWEIRIHRFPFGWKVISGQQFDTYEAARAYVSRVGISEVYMDYTWAIKNPLWTKRGAPL